MKRIVLLFLTIFTAGTIFGEVAYQVPSEITFASTTIKLTRADIRESMDREIVNFTYMHSSVIQTLKRANRYLPEVEKILKEEGVPDDFKYLMVIESNVNPLAASPAGAAGLWQFMETTAKEYGLEVNSCVDQRYDITLSTRAACKYLKLAKEKFGSWILAAASYNCGKGRITKELDYQQESSFFDLYLPQETHRYVFRILAAKMLFTNPENFGYKIETKELYAPYQYEEVTVDYAITNLAEWAKNNGITYAQLKELNPWLRTRELKNSTSKKYVIRVIKKSSLTYKPQDVVWNLSK